MEIGTCYEDNFRGSDGVAYGATIDVTMSGGRRVQIDRPSQKLVPLEINAIVTSKRRSSQ